MTEAVSDNGSIFVWGESYLGSLISYNAQLNLKNDKRGMRVMGAELAYPVLACFEAAMQLAGLL